MCAHVHAGAAPWKSCHGVRCKTMTNITRKRPFNVAWTKLYFDALCQQLDAMGVCVGLLFDLQQTTQMHLVMCELWPCLAYHPGGHRPQYSLHHGQMLPVIMSLGEGWTNKTAKVNLNCISFSVYMAINVNSGYQQLDWCQHTPLSETSSILQLFDW